MSLTRRTTYTPNTIIDADVHNLEHDDYVAGINQAVKNTGDEVIAGIKGFSSLPYTSAGDPGNDNDLSRKAYVDGRIAGSGKGFIRGAAPVYLTTATFSVAGFNMRNSVNDGNITLATSVTLDIATTGANGIAVSANLTGTVTISASSTAVTGTGTKFLTDFIVGDVITPTGGNPRRITAIASDTALILESATSGATLTGVTYKRGGRATNTWYFLYGATDGTSPCLLLSTRNMAKGEIVVDLPFTATGTLGGTVATTNGTTTIAGTSTNFTTDYQVGDTILVNGGNQLTIVSITNNTTMVASINATVILSGVTHTRVRGRIRQMPFAVRCDGSALIQSWDVAAGWPSRPCIKYREYTSQTVYGGLTSTSFLTTDCSAFIPPISRFGEFYVKNIGGAGGLLSIRPTGTSLSNGRETSALNGGFTGAVESGCDNLQRADMKVNASTWGVYVTGYVITEI